MKCPNHYLDDFNIFPRYFLQSGNLDFQFTEFSDLFYLLCCYNVVGTYGHIKYLASIFSSVEDNYIWSSFNDTIYLKIIALDCFPFQWYVLVSFLGYVVTIFYFGQELV